MEIGDTVQIINPGANFPYGTDENFEFSPLFRKGTRLQLEENHHLWKDKTFTIVDIRSNWALIHNEHNEFVLYLSGLEKITPAVQNMPSLQELL